MDDQVLHDLRTRLAAALDAALETSEAWVEPECRTVAVDATRAILDQELDGLYARLRDAEDARKAAVGIIEKQNAGLADVRHERRSMAERAGKAQATLASVRALHCDLGSGICEECSAPLRYPFLPVPYPCRTVKALNA